MKQLVDRAGMTDSIYIDSAGLTSDHHGCAADSRMRAHGLRRGYILDSISRPVTVADFEDFDIIIGMDNENIRQLKSRTKTPEQRAKIQPMCDYIQNMPYTEVPDPYYGGEEGFEIVLDILEDACAGLLEAIAKR